MALRSESAVGADKIVQKNVTSKITTEGESMEEDMVVESYPDGPMEFGALSWPHPRLVDNMPQGRDEALVWYMDYYREHLNQRAQGRKGKRSTYRRPRKLMYKIGHHNL